MNPREICPCCREFRTLLMYRGGLCEECAPMIERDDRERDLADLKKRMARLEGELEEERRAFVW